MCQQKQWSPTRQGVYGYVDTETGAKECTLPKDALVFLLNCINENKKGFSPAVSRKMKQLLKLK